MIMVYTTAKFSRKRQFLRFLTFLTTQIVCVSGIPINFANNPNVFNDNHANRHPNQPPPPVLLQRPHSQFPQSNQNQGPEMEDFGRLKRNHFRRHAMLPPHVRSTPPGAFQPSEQFGANFHQTRFDETSQQHQHFNHFPKHQTPTSNFHGQMEETQDIHQRSQREYERGNSQDLPIPPQMNSFNRFNDGYVDEAQFLNTIPIHHIHNPHSMLNDNEIFREESGHWSGKKSNPFDNHHPKPREREWKEQQHAKMNKVPKSFTEFHGHHFPGKPNMLPVPNPTAIVLVKPGIDGRGNSTFFVEYDISDKAVTYETIVEVDDLGENIGNNYHSHDAQT